MSNPGFTYRIRAILIAALTWELVFWALTGTLLYLLGFIDNETVQRMGFRHPDAFWLLLLLIPLTGIYLFNLQSTNRIAESTSVRLRQLVLSPVSSRLSFIRFFLYRNAFTFLIFALAQPVFGTKKVSGTIESMEIVICLDISNSMNTRDISRELSRLEIAKRAIIQLVNNLHGEKIGVALFAGNAFVQLPLTSDYSAAKLFVSDITTDMISVQGTNIKSALSVSKSMFSEQKCSKAIILVTDGENHEEDPTPVLTELKESGVVLSVLGIGTTSGGPVPQNPDRPELGYKTSPTGGTVVSRVNPSLIRKLAATGKGTAIISDSEFPDMRELLTQINQMKRSKLRDLQFDMKENRFRIPLFLGLLFWCLYLFMNKEIYFRKK